MSVKMPKVTMSIIAAALTASGASQRVLLIGQKLAGGTAVAGALIQDFANGGEEDGLFDKNSHIAGVVRAFKRLNKITALDVIPLDDAGAAVKATSIITLATGPASANAEIFVTIGSEKNARHKITITSGDTITEIAAAIVAAFAADTKKPFTIAAAIGVVTATATNGGTIPNDWGIQVEGSIPGVTIATTAWAGGATDPTLTSVLDVIGNIRYQTIVWPSAYSLSVVQTLLDARFNSANDVKDGVVFQQKVDTLANLKVYVTQNSQSVVVVGQKKITATQYKGPATMEFSDEAVAQIAAIRALRLTPGAVLTQFLTTVASGDQFGGPEIASLPYFNTSIPNLPVAKPENQFSDVDIEELSNKGIAFYGPNSAFNNTIMGEFVTTYLTDPAGNADLSYKFLNTVDTASTIREYFFVNWKKTYAQSRLTDGDLIAGRDMANESSIRVLNNKLYQDLADQALTQKGAAAAKDFNLNLSIVVDVLLGKTTINMAPLLVSGLRVIIATMQINFG